MKKIFLFSFTILSISCLTKCGPAAEDREKMHQNAKRVSDSIAKSIDSALVVKP